MAVANVNAKVIPIGIGGNTDGYKSGWILGADKAKQNDTITVTNAKTVFKALLTHADGTLEKTTVSENVITCTDSNTTKVLSGVILYKEF